MRSIGQALTRLPAGIVHAALNTAIIATTGKYFLAAWTRLGRGELESDEALAFVAIVMSLATIVFWLAPVRRRLAAATVVTALAIVATAVGSFALGTQGPGCSRCGRAGGPTSALTSAR
jgi:hypothetical protein